MARKQLVNEVFVGGTKIYIDPDDLVAVQGGAFNNAYFVAKHGLDSNDGKSPYAPKLTIQAAINLCTAAADLVVVLDSGTYTERLATPAVGCIVWAPNATLVNISGGGLTAGALNLNGPGDYRFRKITAVAGTSAISRADTAGTARVVVDEIDARATGCIGALNLSTSNAGVLMLKTKQVYVGQSSIGIGSAAVGTGHTHLEFEDIYLAGNSAVGIIQAIGGGSGLVVRGDHILEDGTPTTTTAISIAAGTADILILDIFGDTAWNVGASGTLNLHYHRTTGTQTETGTVNVSFSGMGARVEALSANPSGATTTTSAAFVAIDANLTGVSFTLPTAGTWKIVFRFSGYHNTATNSVTSEYELIFDDGEANEQIWVEATTKSMQLSHYTAGERKYRSAETALDFTAGDHTIGVKWKRVGGAQSLGVSAADHFNVVMTRLR